MLPLVASLVGLIAAIVLVAAASRRLRDLTSRNESPDRWIGFHLPALAALPIIVGAATAANRLDAALVTPDARMQGRLVSLCVVAPLLGAAIGCAWVTFRRTDPVGPGPVPAVSWLLAGSVALLLIPIQRLGFLDAELLLLSGLSLLWLMSGSRGTRRAEATEVGRGRSRVGSLYGLAFIIGVDVGVAAGTGGEAAFLLAVAAVLVAFLGLAFVPGRASVPGALRVIAFAAPVAVGIGLGVTVLVRMVTRIWGVASMESSWFEGLMSVAYLLAFEPPEVGGFGAATEPILIGLLAPAIAWVGNGPRDGFGQAVSGLLAVLLALMALGAGFRHWLLF